MFVTVNTTKFPRLEEADNVAKARVRHDAKDNPLKAGLAFNTPIEWGGLPLLIPISFARTFHY
jgi:hypothetical protein